MAKISKRDAYTIVLEEIRSNFRAFGDGLLGLTAKVDAGFREVGERLDRLEANMVVVKLDINDMKLDNKEFKRKFGNHEDRLQDHEIRISNLETT